MPLAKTLTSLPYPYIAADGYLNNDRSVLTPYQQECSSRLGMTIQLEHEAYLSQHCEVSAMLKILTCNTVRSATRKKILTKTAEYFMRPVSVLDKEIRQKLGIESCETYIKSDRLPFTYEDKNLEMDLRVLLYKKYYPIETFNIPTPIIGTSTSVSSSFLSIRTSESTLPTPEPLPPKELTLSETMFIIVSNVVDKAIFFGVDDYALRYDTAYVELCKTVEEAMEITVTEIKLDIIELFFKAYQMFEAEIVEKERIAAEISWQKRMRKNMKRTLRRLNNFKGYTTPPTPKSQMSSHESYLLPALRPCKCHPQWNYNRYPKDHFGIYMPSDVEYNNKNSTITPVMSLSDLQEI